jgi:hypothetical protein
VKERERVARLVRALMAKTTEAGTTEAEAMTAAEKIRELLETHQMNMSEAELISDGYAEVEFSKGDNVKKQVFRFLSACICKWTGTTALRHTTCGRQTKIVVFGRGGGLPEPSPALHDGIILDGLPILFLSVASIAGNPTFSLFWLVITLVVDAGVLAHRAFRALRRMTLIKDIFNGPLVFG